MTGPFVKYFFKYIFHAKSRQRLLLMAVVGLVISSFALLVLQSTMGGLQETLITRSKNVNGSYVVHLDNIEHSEAVRISEVLRKEKVKFTLEYEIELLLRHFNYISPVILHGVSKLGDSPSFLGGEYPHSLVLPYDLGYKIMAEKGSETRIISPSHLDDLIGEVPRMSKLDVERFFSTSVPEVDALHAWVRIGAVQNLIRSRSYNRVRVFGDYDLSLMRSIFTNDEKIITWEDSNRALLYSLKLENTIMIFLFICMTMLVSICITSGLMIFFNKVKKDLASFWILGSSNREISKGTDYFVYFIGLMSSLSGIILGLIILMLFDRFGGNIMPDVFVDRKIPVNITTKGVLISFLVPFVISTIFSKLVVRNLFSKQDHLDYVRSLGS